MNIHIALDFLDDAVPILPTKAHDDDAGWDLYVSRDVILNPHRFTDVHTDVSIAMPSGWFGFITGRSSTIRNKLIRVENGIIDAGYRGELCIGTWNLNDTSYKLERGTRIAQLLLLPVPQIQWMQTESLPPSFRSVAGFGSSGE